MQLFIGKKHVFHCCVRQKKREGGGWGALDFQHRVTPTRRIWLVVKMSGPYF